MLSGRSPLLPCSIAMHNKRMDFFFPCPSPCTALLSPAPGNALLLEISKWEYKLPEPKPNSSLCSGALAVKGLAAGRQELAFSLIDLR